MPGQQVAKHVRAPLQKPSLPERRFGHLHMDLVGPLPQPEGYSHLFTMVDRWSRWPEVVPLADITVASCANALIRGWIARFGVPNNLTSHRGTQFTSSLWAGMGKLLAVRNITTTSNGLVERFHRTLKASLMATGDLAGWMGRLPHVLLGIRTAQRPDVGFWPAECLYGADLVLAPAVPLPDSNAPLQDFTAQLKVDMAATAYPETMWHAPEKKSQIPAALAQADFVFVRHGARRVPLSRPYDGPYRVVKRDQK